MMIQRLGRLSCLGSVLFLADIRALGMLQFHSVFVKPTCVDSTCVVKTMAIDLVFDCSEELLIDVGSVVLFVTHVRD